MMLKRTNTFSTANVIQVKIDSNIRMLAELHARWKREDKIAKENNIARVYTITTTTNADVWHAVKPPTINGNIICVGNISTTTAKRLKLSENTKTIPNKSGEIFQNVEDHYFSTIDHNAFDFDDCNIFEVIISYRS